MAPCTSLTHTWGENKTRTVIPLGCSLVGGGKGPLSHSETVLATSGSRSQGPAQGTTFCM